jgi:cytochrome bd ubiquinol oxidase subunit II
MPYSVPTGWSAAAYRLIPYLAVGLFALLVVVFVYAMAKDLRVMHRWLERSYLFIFPVIGVIAALMAAQRVPNRRRGIAF